MIIPIDQPPSGDARTVTIDVSALTARQLDELGRLRTVGMEKTRQLGGAMEGLSPRETAQRLSGRHGLIGEFDRIARAVRQVIRLELELVGLIPAVDRDAVENEAIEDDREYLAALDERDPDGGGTERDDLRDPVDYRRGPLDVVVASVRKTLGVAAPEDDPFAPVGRRGAGAKTTEKALRSPPPSLPHRGGGIIKRKAGVPTPSPSMGEGRGEGDVADRSTSTKSALLGGAAAMPGGWRFGNRGPPGGGG